MLFLRQRTAGEQARARPLRHNLPLRVLTATLAVNAATAAHRRCCCSTTPPSCGVEVMNSRRRRLTTSTP